jgi:hypothetical protein
MGQRIADREAGEIAAQHQSQPETFNEQVREDLGHANGDTSTPAVNTDT